MQEKPNVYFLNFFSHVFKVPMKWLEIRFYLLMYFLLKSEWQCVEVPDPIYTIPIASKIDHTSVNLNKNNSFMN